jgi:transposase
MLGRSTKEGQVQTDATIRLTPLTGRAPRGARFLGQVPRNWGVSTTPLANMTWDGMAAAMMVEGATDQPVFETFVREAFASTLVPGQIEAWDDLSVHKSLRARHAIAEWGYELRVLPPYSPDFIPSEQAFSKFKPSLRRTEARSQDWLWGAIDAGLQQITAEDARGLVPSMRLRPYHNIHETRSRLQLRAQNSHNSQNSRSEFNVVEEVH